MDFDKLRKDMVKKQLENRGITNKKVLNAFLKVPRHEFVPESFIEESYDDNPLSIGGGQTISQPFMVAAMTELLELTGKEKVLEIGTGSGYQAAILAELVKEVITIERIEALADHAKKTLKKLGYNNVKVVVGDGTTGYEKQGPYDGIVVTASAPKIPEPLKKQLKNNGKLVIPVDSRHGQDLVRVTKKGNNFEEETEFGCIFVPLLGKFGWND